MSQTSTYTGTVWRYSGVGGWYFVSLSLKESQHIKTCTQKVRPVGWGSVPVSVRLGTSTWKTSLFPDKTGVYLLPVKAKVRSKEGIHEGDRVTLSITYERHTSH
jgi:Domain of unknown function (DUF1905)